MSTALHNVAQPKASAPIDYAMFFMPEQFTPLFHTSSYPELTGAERRRYNQLHALYFNEQIRFFERSLARTVLGHLLRAPLPHGLSERVREFIAEEDRHSELFLALNRQCAPEFYRDHDYYCIRVPPVAGKVLAALSSRPTLFPLFLWLMLLQEERSLHYGKVFAKADLEPNFVALQRLHIADEAGHVQCDELLLDWLWPRTNLLLRHLNVRLLCWMMNEFFMAPKRAGMRVIQQLADEFSSLRPAVTAIAAEVRSLAKDLNYRRSFYPSEFLPRTFSRLERFPELAPLRTLLYPPVNRNEKGPSSPRPSPPLGEEREKSRSSWRQSVRKSEGDFR